MEKRVAMVVNDEPAFLAWFLGWDVSRTTDPLRASAGEAGERTADGIAEFWDWLRLGR